MSAYELAKGIRVDPPRIYKIVKGERGISGDTALRLARCIEEEVKPRVRA